MSCQIQCKEQGFTLIEILLVIVMMTVLSAMVVPSFFQSTGTSLKDEARYMQKILRLVSEDAQLTGGLERCSVYSDHLTFERLTAEGKWQGLVGDEFKTLLLQTPVMIKQAHLHGDVGLDDALQNNSKAAAIARFHFWPDGRVTNGEITLSTLGRDDSRVIHLGSGPAGIYVVESKL